jgi:iron complex outermembrane receptor protein
MKSSGTRACSLAAAIGAVLAAAAQPAYSQQSNAQSLTLQEVVVTARKTRESLQDTPVAVTAFSGEALQEMGVVDLRGIANATPNMEFSYAGNGSGGGNFAQIFLRGVGQPDFIITKDPGVGVYIDGVYLARAPGSVLELLDVESIEVLRGPQGTLFGKNTIGGAVQVSTKRPNNDLSGVAQLTTGSYNRMDLSGSLNVPLVADTLALRVSAMSRTQDGYYRRLAYSEGPANQFGSDASREAGNNTDRQSGRVGVLWTPTDNVDVFFSADVTKERQDAVEYQLIAVPGASLSGNIRAYNQFYATPNGLPTYGSQWITTEPWTTYSTWPGYNNSDVWGSSLSIDWRVGGIEVKSITGYRELEVQTKGDADGTPAEIVSSGGIDILQFQFSQEVQLSGKAFGDSLNWIGGLWYFDESAMDTQRSRQQAGLYEAVVAAPADSLVLTPGVPGCTPSCTFGGPANANNARLDNSRTGSRRMLNSSYAAFAHVSYAFTDQWSMSLGARISHEEKEFNYYEVRPLRPGVVSFDTYQNNPNVPVDEWDVFTPKLGVEYRPTDDLMFYAQYSTGFKAGGYNGRPSSATALQSFDEEELVAYEAGMKSEWFENTMRLNLSAFLNDYTDIQITRLRADLAGVRLEENAGDGKIKGIEVEFQWMPVAGLNLGASIGYQDFEFKSLLTGVQLGCTIDACKLPFAPETTAGLTAAYVFPVGELGNLSLRADYKYSDKYYIDADNTEAVAQDAYSTLDARISLAAFDKGWDLFVGGTNITNEAVIANGVTSVPNNSQVVTYKPPRQWYAGVRVNF